MSPQWTDRTRTHSLSWTCVCVCVCVCAQCHVYIYMAVCAKMYMRNIYTCRSMYNGTYLDIHVCWYV